MAFSLGTIFLSGTFTLDAFISGPVLAAPLIALSLVSGGTWMGWGDGLFELSLGWLLGTIPGLTALMLGIWSGALFGIVLVVWAQLPWKYRSAGFTMKSELPFAPFLALGAVLVYFFHVDLFSNLSYFW